MTVVKKVSYSKNIGELNLKDSILSTWMLFGRTQHFDAFDSRLCMRSIQFQLLTAVLAPSK